MENPIKSTDSYCFSVLFVSLVTCGNKNPESDIRESDIGSGEKGSSSSSLKAIVVYFSASGHTQKVSETIADYLSLPIYELEPVNPYTDDLNYSNSSSRVVKEHQQRLNGEELTVALKKTRLKGFEEADYVFLGAPVWWQELSWVVEDFVRKNDFTGKTILPYGTSASSSFSLSDLSSLSNEATWEEGKRFPSSASSASVRSWIDSLNRIDKAS